MPPRPTLIDQTILSVRAVDDNGDPVSAAEGLTDAELRATPVEIEGEVELGATTLAALETITVGTQPARAATTDNIGAKLATDAIMDGVTACTPKFAVIDHAASGDNTIIAANATKKLRVLAAVMIAGGTVTARFESAAGGTALTGQMALVANSGFVLPFNPAGWFETAANQLLNLELSGAVSVDGCLTYIEV